MNGKMMTFGAGAAIGYLLGTRAGRERYDEITGQAKRIWESDTVQEAAGVMQMRAGQLYDQGKRMVSDQAHKMSENRDDMHANQSRRLRKRGFAERNRKAPQWQAPSSMDVPAGNPPTTASPPTTPATPY